MATAANRAMTTRRLNPERATAKYHPSGWRTNLPRLIKPTDTEKITINLGFVDLGRIDLLGGRLLHEQDRFHPRGGKIAPRQPCGGGRAADRTAHARRGTARLHCRRSRSGPRGRGNPAHQGRRACTAGLRHFARACPGHHRFDQCARCASGFGRGPGSSWRPHPGAFAHRKGRQDEGRFLGGPAPVACSGACRQSNGIHAPHPGGFRAAPAHGAALPPSQAAGPRRSRRPLSQVLEGLARRPAGGDLRPKGKAPQLDIPEGASFERMRHDGPHGARDYLLYRPSAKRGPARGVILMLHGCTQTPEDFAAGTRMHLQAEEHGLLVAYPEQSRAGNAQLCWNWFRPGDQGRMRGEAAQLAGLAASLAGDNGVPPDRVFVAGLSAGGAMAAILANTHPEVIAAAGVHSGLAPGWRRTSSRPLRQCAGTRRPAPNLFARLRSSFTDRPTRRWRR